MKHKVGDHVTVRTWESMAHQYGVCNPHGSAAGKFIPKWPNFTRAMDEDYSGKTVTITGIGDGTYVVNNDLRFTFADWMFEDEQANTWTA